MAKRISHRRREIIRAATARHRARNPEYHRARFQDWARLHRVYLAAYARVRRRLASKYPEMSPRRLRIKCRRIASRLSEWAGEAVL